MYLKIFHWENHVSSMQKYFHSNVHNNRFLGLSGITYFTVKLQGYFDYYKAKKKEFYSEAGFQNQFSEKDWNTTGFSPLMYWVEMTQCWQQSFRNFYEDWSWLPHGDIAGSTGTKQPISGHVWAPQPRWRDLGESVFRKPYFKTYFKNLFKMLNDSSRRKREECVHFTYVLLHIALQTARWEKREGRCPCSLLMGPHQNRYAVACGQQGMGKVWGERSCREDLLRTDLSSHSTLTSAVCVVESRRVRSERMKLRLEEKRGRAWQDGVFLSVLLTVLVNWQ